MKARTSHRRRRHSAPGSAPGTLTVDPDAPKPQVRIVGYGPDDATEQPIDDLDEIAEARRRWPVVWVNVDGLGDADVLRRLGDLFGLHALALEDVVNVGQRPKAEHYPEHLFLVTRMATLNERLETEQMSLFVGPGFVLSFQERAGDCLESVRERIRRGTGRLRGCGADYLAYCILDAVVDAYFPVLEQFGEQIEALEDLAVGRPETSTVRRIHRAKRNLLTLRRMVWPLREVTSNLLREGSPLLAEGTRPYLADCHDHVVQIMDMLETYRELASGLMDVYMSSVSNRMNQVMKVLTVIATIFIPLTFVAGIYGMNFNPDVSPWNMPELNWAYGYPVAMAVMLAIGAAMALMFHRKGWLGERREREDERER